MIDTQPISASEKHDGVLERLKLPLKDRCEMCSELTPMLVKRVTCGSPKGRWMFWCGCGMEVNQSSLSPRFEYDCSHCRFNWNCGPLGTCLPKLPKAPKTRMAHVKKMIAEYQHR